MKLRKLLPFKEIRTSLRLLNQKGQTIVEFVLLLVVISSISYGFVAFMNRNLAKYWEYSVNLIVDDRPGTKTVTFK